MPFIDLFNEEVYSPDVVNSPLVNTQYVNVSAGLNLDYIAANSVLKTDASKNVVGSTLAQYEILQGNSLSVPLPTSSPIFNNIGLNGLTKQTTVKATNSTVDSTLNIPDPGLAAANFIVSDTLSNTQTINSDLVLAGIVEHQDAVKFSALAPYSALHLDASKFLVPETLNDGQFLVGSTGLSPAPANITSTGGTISVTNGPNSINLETSSVSSTTGNISLTDATVQIRFINIPGQEILLNAPSPAARRTYTFPDVSADSDFVMCEGTQLVPGIKSFKSRINIGDPSYGALNTNNVLNKYCSSGGSYQVLVDDTLSNFIYTIPDVAVSGGSTSASFIMSEGQRTLNGISTFKNTIIANSSANHLQFFNGAASTGYTLTSTTPTFSRSINIPDPAANSYFILGNGANQVINIGTNQSLFLKGDSSSSAPSQLLIQGATDTSKQLSSGIDTTNNLGSVSYFNNVSQATSSLCLQKPGGYVQIGNGFLTPANNTVGSTIIYGSGTTDVSDVLKVRENTNTNPKEIFIGYNTTGNYGVIQSVQWGTGYKDTRISPNGGNVYVGKTGTSGGIVFPNTNSSGATYQTLMSDYVDTSFSQTFSCGSGVGGTTATVTVSLQKIGSRVFLYIPIFSITSGSVASPFITASTAIPSGLRPVTDCHVGAVRCNSAGTTTDAFVYIQSNVIAIYQNVAGTNFPVSSTVGLVNISAGLSYYG